MRIKLTTMSPDWPWCRQTPASLCHWDDCEFIINQPTEQCDAWVVYDGIPDEQRVICPPSRTVLILGEPPTIHRYSKAFIRQFSVVVTCQAVAHCNVIHRQQAMPWHIGIHRVPGQSNTPTYDLDRLRAAGIPPKTRNVSVICTNKAMTRGHRQRLGFIKCLQAEMGDQVDLFGRGFRDVADKWDAIAPYRYHIVLENSVCRDYWTEKFSDALLGGALPIYHGCPNMTDYFEPAALVPIDITKPHEAVEIIRKTVSHDWSTQQAQAVQRAKELIMDRYNIFPMLADLCKSIPAQVAKPVVLKPERSAWWRQWCARGLG